MQRSLTYLLILIYPVCLCLRFPQHGFRKTPNIKRSLDGELYFLGKVMGFEPVLPSDFVPLDIANLN